MNNSAKTGNWGERIVADRLRAEGCQILERNWRCGRYEIDIIALKDCCLRFVEVKTRSAMGWTRPEDAVTQSKCRAVHRAASAYMASRYRDFDFRFDLAAVEYYPDGSWELRYIERVFESHW